MNRPNANPTLRRLASYALLVALSVSGTIVPSVSEARSPEERSASSSGSGPITQSRGENIGNWFATADDQTKSEPSFLQSWLASVYNKLLGLKAAIGLVLSHAWKWTKPDNACS